MNPTLPLFLYTIIHKDKLFFGPVLEPHNAFWVLHFLATLGASVWKHIWQSVWCNWCHLSVLWVTTSTPYDWSKGKRVHCFTKLCNDLFVFLWIPIKYVNHLLMCDTSSYCLKVSGSLSMCYHACGNIVWSSGFCQLPIHRNLSILLALMLLLLCDNFTKDLCFVHLKSWYELKM